MGQLRFSAVPSLTCSRGGLCVFPIAFPTSSQHQQRVLGQSRDSPGVVLPLFQASWHPCQVTGIQKQEAITVSAASLLL